jgi:hypothetical protein
MNQHMKPSRSDRVNADFTGSVWHDPAWADVVAADGPFNVIMSGYMLHHQSDERKRELCWGAGALEDHAAAELTMELASRYRRGKFVEIETCPADPRMPYP